MATARKAAAAADTAPKVGPVGARVAENVRRLRGRTSVRRLSEQLTELGRPILPSGIVKLEGKQRRVDVDDLVMLAAALDVKPDELLLAPEADTDLMVRLEPDQIEALAGIGQIVRTAFDRGVTVEMITDLVATYGNAHRWQIELNELWRKPLPPRTRRR